MREGFDVWILAALAFLLEVGDVFLAVHMIPANLSVLHSNSWHALRLIHARDGGASPAQARPPRRAEAPKFRAPELH